MLLEGVQVVESAAAAAAAALLRSHCQEVRASGSLSFCLQVLPAPAAVSRLAAQLWPANSHTSRYDCTKAQPLRWIAVTMTVAVMTAASVLPH